MSLPKTIKTEEDVRSFFTHLVREENLNFHPDTPFSDYINYDTHEPTYTPEEAALRDSLMNQCFEVAGDRAYEIGLEVLKPVLTKTV